jgi:trk system potassium uptake protein TrkA
VDSFELSDDFSIIEANVTEKYVGKTVREIGFRNKFNLLVLTTIKKSEVKSLVGKSAIESKVQGVVTPDYKLDESDILVLYGSNKDLQVFLNQKHS